MPATRVVICVGLLAAIGCDSRTEPATLATPTPAASLVPPIEVTAEAANAVRQHLADQPELARCYLRLRVVPGGCQGFMHKLDLDPVVSPEDYTFESGGVKVVVLARQIELLRGTTVDFGRSSEGDKVGFKVENPNFKGEACKRSVEVLQEEPVAK